MNTTTGAPRSKIEIRTTPAQKLIIEQAAEAEGVNVTAFIFSRIIPEATRIVGERSVFFLNSSDWDKFNAILDRPAKPSAQLRDLATTPSVLEERRKAHGRARKS